MSMPARSMSPIASRVASSLAASSQGSALSNICEDWAPPLLFAVAGLGSPAMDRITFNPNQSGGRPCIRGMRIRVKDVLDLLAAGVSEAEVLADFPYLESEDIRACLVFAAAEADHPVLVAADR
jgi:uncharacterized protein (DUF433 family)